MSEANQIDEPTTHHKVAQVALSRCWAQRSAHNPFYSGGKLVTCHTRGTQHVYGTDTECDKWTPFLLTQHLGDLCIVDARQGCNIRTIRKGCLEHSSFQNSEDSKKEDEEEDDSAELDADAIVSYALAPNDIDLITASRNQLIRQYNISGNRLSYHSSSVTSNSDDRIQGGDGKGRARVQRTLGKSGHDLPVTHMEFHPSGIFFATGSVDGKVKVWDIRGGYITHSFQRHHNNTSEASTTVRGRSSVSGLVWCQDITKLWLAVGREDGSIQIHDLRQASQQMDSMERATPTLMAHLQDHLSAVTCMIWNTSLHTFFSAGRDAVINVWSISTQELAIQDDVRNKHAGRSDQKKAKNKRIKQDRKEFSTTELGTTQTSFVYKRIFTLPIYEQIEGMILIPNPTILSTDLSRDDLILATAGTKGVVRLWKAIRRTQDPTITDLVLWKQQSKQSAFGEKKGGYTHLMLTKPLSDTPSTHPNIHATELLVVDAEHNISYIPLTTESTTSDLTPTRTIVGHNDEILDLKIIPKLSGLTDEEQNPSSSLVESKYRIAVATNSPQVRIFDVDTFSSQTLHGHVDTVLSLDVSPCGRFLATCGKDKTMRIWTIDSSICVAIARGHTEAIGTTAFSRKVTRYDLRGKAMQNGSGAFAVTASNDHTLKRWNLPGASDLIEKSLVLLKNQLHSGEDENDSYVLELRVYESVKAHEKDINIVRVAPNDSLVATGSQDKTVKIWDTKDLSLRGTLRGHKRGVWDCQFSPYDRVVATSSGDKTIKLWSLTDYSCVRTFQGHLSTVLRVRFLCGGLQMVSSGSDGLVKLWTIRTNECEGTMDGHHDKVWALDLSLDGSTLVSGGADSKIVVWGDITTDIQDEKRAEEERNILLEQKLQNHLRFKEYKEALDIALEMDKPRQALKVFMSILEGDSPGDSSSNALSRIQYHVKSWSMDRTSQVLRYCREWNTRARNSAVAMTIINAIFTTIPAKKLVHHEGIPEILSGIIPYAERHFDRIDKLSANAYLVDFVLSAMGTLFVEEEDKGYDEYPTWVAASKLILPEKKQEVKVTDINRLANSQATKNADAMVTDDDNNEEESQDIITVGDSSSDESDWSV